MKYNKCYSTNNCQNSMNTRYTVDKDNYVSNNYPHMGGCEAQEIVEKDECCEMDLSYNNQNNCNNNTCSCNLNGDSNKVCSNCNNNCNSCKPYECDMNSGKVEGIRTIIKRLFSKTSIDSCPSSQEIIMVDGEEYIVTFNMFSSTCKCDSSYECPSIDANTKFICKCVTVDTDSILLGNLDVKLNGKLIRRMRSKKELCYSGKIRESILSCTDKCLSEKVELCIKAEDWSINATFSILGCVITGGETCDFKITIKPSNPIILSDSIMFYKKDFCVTDGKLKVCFEPEVCLNIDSIVPVEVEESLIIPEISAIIKLNVVANINLIKKEEVCIQAVVVK